MGLYRGIRIRIHKIKYVRASVHSFVKKKKKRGKEKDIRNSEIFFLHIPFPFVVSVHNTNIKMSGERSQKSLV